jgi:hypothetical protein
MRDGRLMVIDAHTHTRLVLIMTPHAPLTLYAEATPLSFCNRRVPERELPVEGGLHLPVLGLPGQLGDGVAQLDAGHAEGGPSALGSLSTKKPPAS